MPRGALRAEGRLNRGMADFQYQPAQDDPLSKLRRAMTVMDGQYTLISFFQFSCSDSFLVFLSGGNSGGYSGVPVPSRGGELHH
jgi:hypothetical protein